VACILRDARCAGSFRMTFEGHDADRTGRDIHRAEYASAISRHDLPEAWLVPPQEREQGMPDARCTRGLACNG
jgi:hypothetical protein